MTLRRCPQAHLRALLASAALLGAPLASAQVDVVDPFFRYNDGVSRPAFTGFGDETVDLFSGTLRLATTDVVLPGRGGLDLRITRSYNSRIWLRTDDATSIIDEKSVLGYGWSFHMGRLKNPGASGAPSSACSNDYPVMELPDGSARVFYASSGSPGTLVSRDFWKMQPNCSQLPSGTSGACVWSPSGVRYEFSNSNTYQNGLGTTVWPASRVVDRFGNQISMSYASSGAVNSISDTYGRAISFAYSSDVDGLRLSTMTVNGNVYQFLYTAVSTPFGSRRFLTEVRPPAGPSYRYSYALAVPVSANQYALSAVTYPPGGTVQYAYATTPFYVGGGTSVPIAAVSTRTVLDRGGGALGTWSYTYTSPATATQSTTTVTRPDGLADTYSMFGFGLVASGGVWQVGLTQHVSRASGAELQDYTWTASSALTSRIYSAPGYSSSCSTSGPFDASVVAPFAAQKTITRGSSVYTTSYSSYDAYGQPQLVTENGEQTRTTNWTYFSAPVTPTGQTLNLVRGLPSSQHTCVGTDCFDNSWTYNGPAYAKDSETLTGRRTNYTYDSLGNLASVTNALNQTTTFGGYTNGIATTVNYNGAYTVTRTPSWEGWLLSETNGRNYTTSYTRDAAGRVTQITPPGASNSPTIFTYASDGSAATTTRGSGTMLQTTVFLDGFSREVGTSNSENVFSSIYYDAFGRTTFRSYKYGTAYNGAVGDRYDYDGLGRVVTLTKSYRPLTASCDSPGACTVTTSYGNNNCSSTAVQRASSDVQTTTRCYVSFGNPDEQRLVQTTRADGVWSYASSASGRLTNTTAPLTGGNVVNTLDPTTQDVTSTTTGPAGTTTFIYDAGGNVFKATDSRGVLATYSRADPLARLVGITYQAGSSDDVTLSYDATNNVASRSTVNGGSFSCTYDELNRLTAQTWTTPNWGPNGTHYSFGTSYTYDQYGCLTQMIYPTGTRLRMTCDTQNRVTSIIADHLVGSTWTPIGMSVSSIMRDTSGKPSSMNLGNGAFASFTYDGRSRVTGVSEWVSATNTNILGLSYTYDGAGNVTSFNNSSVSGSNRTMTYDAVNNLETEIAPFMWGTAAYSFDALGNRTMSSEGSYTTNYTYDSQTGRLLSQTGGQSHPAAANYTWDIPGRLASSDGNTFRYDGANRRVAKINGTTTIIYHYDTGGRLIAETNGGATLREYFYLGNMLLGVNDCSSGTCAVEYYHTAANGSVLAVTDMSGALQLRLDYTPSGQLWNPPPNPGERQHRARLMDASLCGVGGCTLSFGTGGALRRAGWSSRPYAPMIGRFIAPRPTVIRGQSLASRLGFTHRHLKIPRSVRLSRAYAGIIGRTHMLAQSGDNPPAPPHNFPPGYCTAMGIFCGWMCSGAGVAYVCGPICAGYCNYIDTQPPPPMSDPCGVDPSCIPSDSPPVRDPDVPDLTGDDSANSIEAAEEEADAVDSWLDDGSPPADAGDGDWDAVFDYWEPPEFGGNGGATDTPIDLSF